jgi:hypothetical protein
LAGQDATFAKQTVGVVSAIRDAVNAEVAKRNAPSVGRKPFSSAAACIEFNTDTDKLANLGFSRKLVGVLTDLRDRYCTEDPNRDKYRSLTSIVHYLESQSPAEQAAINNAVSGLETELETKLKRGTLSQDDAAFAKKTIGAICNARDAWKAHLANRNQSGMHSAGPGQDAFVAGACNQYSGRHLQLLNLGFNTDDLDQITGFIQQYCGKDSPTYLQFPFKKQISNEFFHKN